MPENPPPVVVVEKKRGWGCWGCGCAVLAAIAIAAIAIFVFFGRSIYSMARNMTSEQGITIQTTDQGDAVFTSAQQKVAAFQQAIDQHQPASLHLTGDEINTLIARDPAYAKLKGHLHVDLKGDTAALQASFQLGQFETFMLADRYFNGTVTTGIGFDPATHQVSLDLRQLQVGDKPIPESSISGLNQALTQNANTQLQANPNARDFINHASKIAIENGELVIETK